MEAFQLYFVATMKYKPGKGKEAVKWWKEKGKALYESMPGVLSVKAYAGQFGLGREYGIEIWLNLENYAALDSIDVDLEAKPQKYAAFADSQDLFEGGPARVMGDWPESHWDPAEE